MSCQVPLLLTIHVAKLHTCQYYSHQGYVVTSTQVYVLTIFIETLAVFLDMETLADMSSVC